VAKAENSVILLEDNYKANYKGFDPNSAESVIGLTLMQEEYLDQSIQLASIIQEGFTNKLKRKDRGVKQAGFVVLHQTYMPSILIEFGFLTNKSEGLYLNSKTGQQKFSQSIYKNILKYIKQLTLNTVVNNEVVKGKSKKSNTKTTVKGAVVKNKPKIGTSKKEGNINENIQFKVQIAAGARKLETYSYNFKGLKNVERVKVGKIYRYYLGQTSSYSKIKKFQKSAKSKGYRSAFIVAFKKGKKISIDDVLKKS